jgi:hypothetical protein
MKITHLEIKKQEFEKELSKGESEADSGNDLSDGGNNQ